MAYFLTISKTGGPERAQYILTYVPGYFRGLYIEAILETVFWCLLRTPRAKERRVVPE